jgi:hypothetical protein
VSVTTIKRKFNKACYVYRYAEATTNTDTDRNKRRTANMGLFK